MEIVRGAVGFVSTRVWCVLAIGSLCAAGETGGSTSSSKSATDESAIGRALVRPN